MIKLLNSLLIVLLLAGMAACKNDLEIENDGHHRDEGEKKERVLKTIRMSFGGDFITETDEPLLRAEDGDTYTAINVWRSEKKDNGTVGSEERYAYGLFKGTDDISVDVVTGFVYRFESSILIERDDKVKQLEYKYVDPFMLSTLRDNSASMGGYSRDDIQKFKYSAFEQVGENQVTVADLDRFYFCNLFNGTACIIYGKKIDDWGEYKYPRVKRFYGNLVTYDPEISNAVEIPMSYKSFGLKIVVEDLPSGHITIEDISAGATGEEDKLLFPNGLTLQKSNEWEGLYSMNNLLASSETFKFRFTWHKGGGVTESFPTDVTIRPKTKKVLKVKITGTPNVETKGNVTFNMESDELTLDEEEVSHAFD